MPTTTSTQSWLVKPLLALLPAALFLSSCQEPTDIGLDIQPNSEIGVYYIDTVSIVASTVLLDSIQTTGTASQINHLVGFLDDPVLGRITAETYGELRLRENAPTFGTNPVVTSVKLILHYKGAYGITNQPMKLNVHRLDDNAKIEDTTYYSFNTLTYNSAVIGSVTVKPDTIEPVKKGARLFVTIPLDSLFGTEILSMPAANLQNQASFSEALKGLAIVPETNAGRSIINFGFDRDIDSSFVQIFYKNNETPNGTSFRLFLDKSSKRFHSIKADRAGTQISGINANGDVIGPISINGSQGETFIQSGIGLRTIYKFPYLDSLKARLGNEISINRAELIMPVVGGTTTLFSPPSVLVMAEASGNRVRYSNASTAAPVFIGTDANPLTFQPVGYSAEQGQYKAQLGTYLQSVLYGRKPNRGIVVYPASNAVQLNRVRLQKPYHKDQPCSDCTRLRIYYTKIN